jgi:hypothetical protein
MALTPSRETSGRHHLRRCCLGRDPAVLLKGGGSGATPASDRGYDAPGALEDSTRGRVFAARRSSSGCGVGSLQIARSFARPMI